MRIKCHVVTFLLSNILGSVCSYTSFCRILLLLFLCYITYTTSVLCYTCNSSLMRAITWAVFDIRNFTMKECQTSSHGRCTCVITKCKSNFSVTLDFKNNLTALWWASHKLCNPFFRNSSECCYFFHFEIVVERCTTAAFNGTAIIQVWLSGN